MVNLKSLYLKKAYDSDIDDILNDFYIPALQHSCGYQRLAGFFSSTSLAVSARGILGLIKNGGNLELIVSPKLNKNDLEIILNSLQERNEIVEHRLQTSLENLENELIFDHVSALGWMVANGRLMIKVAIPVDDTDNPIVFEEAERRGLFHQKVGILHDKEGNFLSFSGSVNESASGWLDNIEEFKVFRSWDSTEVQYLQADIEKFNRYWTNQSLRVQIIDLPSAVKKWLIEIAPDDIDKINLDRHYKKNRKKSRIKLFDHQQKAVDEWLRNKMMGIFAMATGTGKTYTALGCLEEILRKNQKLLVVITCPYQHLVQQWKREIYKFGISYDELIIADSSNKLWKDMLADALMDLSLEHKNNVIVITTHTTFPSKSFRNIIREYKSSSKIFLIADEVHGLGAERRQNGLIDEYDYRLGLSATPKRWFDDKGTETIYEYFYGEVYQFGLEEAINTQNPATGTTYLVPYRYVPKFAFLTFEEMDDYVKISRRIGKLYGRASSDEEMESVLEKLLFARANIIKNACEKYDVLDDLIEKMLPSIAWTIIYCSPQQIDTVSNIVNERRIVSHRFTMEEGTTSNPDFDGISERDHLLKMFSERKYEILLAMKCLDEGVDVPPARIAILMASSGNPREYIQRIGRVIRRFPGKHEATIHDIVVLPPKENLPGDFSEFEKTILGNEFKRYEEIAHTAINNAEALSIISEAKEVYLE